MISWDLEKERRWTYRKQAQHDEGQCTLGHRRLHAGELIPALPGRRQIQILPLRRPPARVHRQSIGLRNRVPSSSTL